MSVFKDYLFVHSLYAKEETTIKNVGDHAAYITHPLPTQDSTEEANYQNPVAN